MELQCDICFADFNLDRNRPKVLPCGHTICAECVDNPGLGRKCPTCRKDLEVDQDDLIDNIYVIQLIENDGAPRCKKQRTEETKVQKLKRSVDAARQVVQQLQKVVPLAVEALNRQLDTSNEQLRQMEEAVQEQVRREAAGDDGAPQDLADDHLQLAVQVDDSLRLLTTAECSVLLAEEDGATWRTPLQLGGVGDIFRALLLQLRANGELVKVPDVAAPATQTATPYVGPPRIDTFTAPVLSIAENDLDNGRLKVNDILQNCKRWQSARCIKNLKGDGSETLLRVLAPQLEELEIVGDVKPIVMEEVEKMSSLKRLKVKCDPLFRGDYPDLPVELEELSIDLSSEKQLRCVQRMTRLRCLAVYNYHGPNLVMVPSQHGGLLWLLVAFQIDFKETMLSLIRAHASSLLELKLGCATTDQDPRNRRFYFPDLGQDLAACGMRSLRRLRLARNTASCIDVAACLIQRRTILEFLPSVLVECNRCV
ncbi:uncharacterized protein LOC113203695 [Frankliniella occidentalis]|uniref:Uncharacterized protein LOC113203695 n=1 Tax=Frankliniella occidentalis TaxID=133901 RepID=A0A6J1RZD1_FRAOC|nr:uncharacterized protein LOC113203695 [Frankliniella occidentalis]XP_052129586.1 uncharacterized protein LOC113203695 [Frankliniella occidentalis]XP_052129587.1 uncharacterized protein LOC113203695 [Frankliniella occidentalis]